MDLGSKPAWVLTLALFLPSCAVVGKALNLRVLWFSHK